MIGGKTRAAVLRDVIEIAEFKAREYKQSFVTPIHRRGAERQNKRKG
jgi:hypothetical protein